MWASGVLFCWELLLGMYSVGFIYFTSRLGCPPRFKNFPQTRPWEGFLVFGNFLYYDSFLEWVSVPSSFVSLFIFYILSYLLLKTMGCFSRCLMSSASNQKLFCGVCSAFKCSFDEFVGEEMVSPSYSSTILAPLPSIILVLEIPWTEGPSRIQSTQFQRVWHDWVTEHAHQWGKVKVAEKMDWGICLVVLLQSW